MIRNNIKFSSIDGTQLEGDFYNADKQGELSVLFVHGITSDRKEDNLFVDIAMELLNLNISSFSFDLRAHGKSQRQQNELTLSGCINDIISATNLLLKETNTEKLIIIAASFGGGISINASSFFSNKMKSLILLNPRLDYKPWAIDHEFWDKDQLSDIGKNKMNTEKYIIRNDFKIGMALFNELLCFEPASVLKQLNIPVLFIHGDQDSIVPINISREHFNDNGSGKLIEVSGADHGFVLPDDESATNPQNIKYRNFVINSIVNWIKNV